MIRRLAIGALAAALALASAPSASARGAQQNDRVLRAAGLIRAGKLAAAEAELAEALRAAPGDADALSLLGVVRAQQERLGEAETLFRRAMEASPKHVGAHLNLGELYFTTKRPEQALEVLLAAHELAADRPDLNLKLAALLLAKRDYERASRYLRLVPRPAHDADYFGMMLEALLALDRKEEARALAGEFAAFEGGSPGERARFAMRLARSGMNDAAIAVLVATRAPAHLAASFPVHYTLGIVYAADKKLDKADESLKAALLSKPDDVAALRALARVARALGDHERALAQLVRARRVAPNDRGVLFEFGAAAFQLDLLLDAIPVFDELHRADPREPAYHYALAAARLRNGERAEAASLMKSYAAARPEDAAGYYLLGAALHSLNQFPEARAALSRSLALRPDPDAEYLLGLTLYDEGKREESIATLRRVVDARPDNAGAQTVLGTAYRELGDFAAARAALERAVRLDPTDLRAHYQLGLVYGKLGDKEGAKRMLERAEALRGEQRSRETVRLKLVDPPNE
jgi:tetratricopeptide (TPR) repeat protein